jgi:hypothetical protein
VNDGLLPGSGPFGVLVPVPIEVGHTVLGNIGRPLLRSVREMRTDSLDEVPTGRL